MPSKKKTRKQKILADTRRTQPTKTVAATYSYAEVQTAAQPGESRKNPSHAPAIATGHYHYLLHDLRKTILLTLLITVMQVILMFVINK